MTAPALAAACGVLLAACAGSKLSMAPLASVGFIVALVQLCAGATPAERARVVGGLALPGLVALGPLLALTWLASGSPLGPVLAGALGETAYRLDEIREDLRITVAGHRPSLRYLGLFWGLFVSPLLWAGVAGALVWGRGRLVLAALFAVQAVLLAGWLPFDPRYLGGIQYSAVLVFALDAPARLQRAARSPAVASATALLGLGLWGAAGASPAADVWRVALGLQPAAVFHTTEGPRGGPNTPFFDTWEALDELLPADASLLIYRRWIGAKVSVAYAPRRAFLHPDDVPAGSAPIYLLWLGRQRPAEIAETLRAGAGGRWELGEEVFRDDRVAWQARAEGRSGTLRVFSLRSPAPQP